MSSAYQEAFDALPAAQREARRAAWAQFERLGFPGRRLEDWKYTDLSELAARRFEPAQAAAPALTAGEFLSKAEGLGFENGHCVAGEHLAGMDLVPGSEPSNGVLALNAALAREGLKLRVGAGPPRLLHLLCSQNGGMSHLRHQLHLERGAEATLVVELCGSDEAALSTHLTDIRLDPGSRLTLLRLQRCGTGTTDLGQTQVVVRRDAHLHSLTLDLGAGLSRHDLNVVLAEPGAEVHLDGVFAPGGNTHADIHTRIHHSAAHTLSRETYRGLVFDRATAVFSGRIVVERNAQKTDSEQHIASLLLSDKAQVNAKPELEIYADDVKCAHGATCGQLDDNAVYYLRSRGLSLSAARHLLMFTFAHEVLARIALVSARQRFERALLARLPGGVDLEELL